MKCATFSAQFELICFVILVGSHLEKSKFKAKARKHIFFAALAIEQHKIVTKNFENIYLSLYEKRTNILNWDTHDEWKEWISANQLYTEDMRAYTHFVGWINKGVWETNTTTTSTKLMLNITAENA